MLRCFCLVASDWYFLSSRCLIEWNVLQDHLFPLLNTHGEDPEIVYETMIVLYSMTCLPPVPKILLDDEKQVKQQKWRGYASGAVPSFEGLAKIKEQFARSSGSISVIMRWLAEPLQHSESERSEAESVILDLALNIIRNLLILDPATESGLVLPAALRARQRMAQDALLQKFGEEDVLEMLMLLAHNIEEDENRNWNLIILDILGLIFVKEDPAEILASMDIISGRWLESERYKELQSKITAAPPPSRRAVMSQRCATT